VIRAAPYYAAGYPDDHPMLPHGISVILNAPAVFRYTAVANPSRHLEATRLLGASVAAATEADAGEVLAARIIEIMSSVAVPGGWPKWGLAPTTLKP